MRGGIVLLVLGTMTIQVGAPHDDPLTLVRSIELPHVEGRIDHMAADPDGQRLFMIKGTGLEVPRQINVVLNWFNDLNRLVPISGAK